MRYRSFILAFCLAAPATVPTASLADEATHALTRDGRVLSVETGFRQAFFEPGSPLDDRPVLVLATNSGGTITYEMVPATDDEAVETAPLLLHDKRTDLATLVWKSSNANRIKVQLTQRASDGTWSEVHNLVDLEGEDRRVFHAISTHSVHLSLPNERAAKVRRDIVHLAWWDEDRLWYSAAILAGGSYVPMPSAVDISSSLDELAVVSPTVPAAQLRETISVEGLDSGHLSASFIDRRTDRLVAVEIGVAHIESAFFVDRVVGQLLQVLNPSAPLSDGLRAEMIASGLRADMIASGIRLGMDDALLDFLSTTGELFTAGFFDLNPTATADAWISSLAAHIRELLASIYQTANAAGTIQIDLSGGDVVRVESVLEHPSPETGDGPTRTYIGPGGASAIVGWYEAAVETVFWVEATGDAESPWTEPRALVLGEDLDLDRVDALLRQRIH